MTTEESNPVSEFQKFYEDYTTLELVRKMKSLREQKDTMDTELKGVTAEYEFITRIAIPEKFTEEGIKNMNVDGVGRVGLRADIYASVKAGAKADAYQWLSDIGSQDLIQPAVAPSTLKAFLKDRIKAGLDIPEEFFNCTPYQMATITKT